MSLESSDLDLFTDSWIAEDNMNVQLKDITVTARDGRVSHLEQVYIRGSHVRYFIVPDMLRYDAYV
jgi:small nuclear ribonucleoprotein D3